jgi:hypothetical protein
VRCGCFTALIRLACREHEVASATLFAIHALLD